jgi:hypothetical protein
LTTPLDVTDATEGVIENPPLFALTLVSGAVPHPAASSTSDAIASANFGLNCLDIQYQRGGGSGAVIILNERWRRQEQPNPNGLVLIGYRRHKVF